MQAMGRVTLWVYRPLPIPQQPLKKELIMEKLIVGLLYIVIGIIYLAGA